MRPIRLFCTLLLVYLTFFQVTHARFDSDATQSESGEESDGEEEIASSARAEDALLSSQHDMSAHLRQSELLQPPTPHPLLTAKRLREQAQEAEKQCQVSERSGDEGPSTNARREPSVEVLEGQPLHAQSAFLWTPAATQRMQELEGQPQHPRPFGFRNQRAAEELMNLRHEEAMRRMQQLQSQRGEPVLPPIPRPGLVGHWPQEAARRMQQLQSLPSDSRLSSIPLLESNGHRSQSQSQFSPIPISLMDQVESARLRRLPSFSDFPDNLGERLAFLSRPLQYTHPRSSNEGPFTWTGHEDHTSPSLVAGSSNVLRPPPPRYIFDQAEQRERAYDAAKNQRYNSDMRKSMAAEAMRLYGDEAKHIRKAIDRGSKLPLYTSDEFRNWVLEHGTGIHITRMSP